MCGRRYGGVNRYEGWLFSETSSLLDVDLAWFGSLRLRYNNGENTILQARLYCILVHALGEAKAPVEFSNRALADPELRLRLFVLRDLLVRGFLAALTPFRKSISEFIHLSLLTAWKHHAAQLTLVWTCCCK